MTENVDKRKRRRTPYPYLFRLLHWLLGPSLVVLVLTGLSLHAISRPQWSLLAGRLPSWFWPGRVDLVHLVAAILFSAAIICSLGVYWQRRRRKRIDHLVLLIGGLVMFLSAQLLLNPLGPPAVYWTARGVHAVVGLVVLPVALLWHVWTGLGQYRRALVVAFHPWARPHYGELVLFALVVFAVACLVLSGLPVRSANRELLARRIAKPEEEVVDLEKLPWDEARPLVVELANGGGFSAGRTRVTLRALHDGSELFLSAEWSDPVEDRQYMPWKKTPEGWQRLVTDEDDESVYYEDKFGLAFPTQPDWRFERFGCAIYCHAGGGRAYGYKGSDRIVDVWHWKSTRTDPVGQVDDKYWWKIDFESKNIGRHGDPKEGGGYKKNVSKDKTHPAFLPDGPEAVKQGIILADRAAEYTPRVAAKIRPEQIVPGIVASAAVGDRGDIRCQSHHQDGRWKLFIRRKMDTGSEYDVTFVPDRTYPCGVAAFDRTSKRHAYNLSVHWFVLEQ